MVEKIKCSRCCIEKDVSNYDTVPYTTILKTTCRSCIKDMIELLKAVPLPEKKPEIDRIMIREKELKRQRDYEKHHSKPTAIKPKPMPDKRIKNLDTWS